MTEAPGEGAGRHVEQAILFADLGDSTRLYERLGDERAHELASDCLRRLDDVVQRFAGEIVKHIGDEVMCTFPDPHAALEAACEMQRSVTGPAAEPDLTIHVGLHWGPVLADAGDVFGDAVNLAARMVSLARPGQILTTGDTVQALSGEDRQRTRWVDRRQVKGKHEEIEVHEVIWQDAGMTTVVPILGRSGSPSLRVSSWNTEVLGDDNRRSITIGRADANDLVLEGERVSRQHARLDRRGGKWVLSDRSTNGTVVRPEGGDPVLVHREELLLPAAGSLGVGPICDEVLPVRFEVLPG